MKPTILLLCLTLFTLNGCQSQQQAPPKMTQPIQSETQPTAPPPQTTAPVNTYGSSESTEPPQTLLDYCRLKAQIDLLDLKKDHLESQYRIGTITEIQFHTEKQTINVQIETLEKEKKQTERLLPPNPYLTAGYETKTAQELIELSNALESSEEQLDQEQDKLEQNYQSEVISEEEYLTLQTDLLLKEEQLEMQSDAIETLLDHLGLDD